MRNLETRVAEHESPRHNSYEPAKHLKHHPIITIILLGRNYTSNILAQNASLIAETLFIKQKNPTLNKQVKCFHCNLAFPLGIT